MYFSISTLEPVERFYEISYESYAIGIAIHLRNF
jgi:hypothetical protein